MTSFEMDMKLLFVVLLGIALVVIGLNHWWPNVLQLGTDILHWVEASW